MFDRFLSEYPPDHPSTPSDNLPDFRTIGQADMFSSYNAVSFGSGIYKVINIADIDHWRTRIDGAFPQFRDRVDPFGFDWLGRFFCLDKHRRRGTEPLVLLFSPFSNETLEIPATFVEFHNEILVDHAEPALEQRLFAQFLQDRCIRQVAIDQCADLTVSLYLGGFFSIANMSLIDLDLYWQLSGQMLSQIQSYPAGTSIREVKLIRPN